MGKLSINSLPAIRETDQYCTIRCDKDLARCEDINAARSDLRSFKGEDAVDIIASNAATKHVHGVGDPFQSLAGPLLK